MKQAVAAQALRGAGGMGIVEMIVGLALMTVAILGLSGLAVSATRANVTARLLDQATRLAQQKMEQVRQAGYTAAAPGTTIESNLTAAGSAGGSYTRTTVIAAGPLSTTRTVTVSIAWDDYASRRSATFATEIIQ